ncbi:hypothetical protein SteCoe_31641 [Stentor coeruleus]|uniref:Dynein regulatory complex protein 10 n=1 Tax=Stentor coeruleus TaxID=5963 RepID=A0A1R2B0T4_9CILI|nr:hypothetical protein SteCoe_31641 [Stentor coeruleus]
MTRPSHVDSQRIVSLLEELNQRLEVLAWLTEENLTEISTRQEDFSAILDPGLVKCLMVHLSLLREFNNFNPNTDGHVIDLEEKPDNVSDKDYEVADLLEKNTVDLTRWLTTDKDSFRFLSQSINNDSPGVSAFVDVSKDLRKLYLTKLITPVEEELSRERELEEIEQKLKKSKAEEADNNERLINLRRQREEGRENRNKEKHKLNIELEKNERETNDAIRDMLKKKETKMNKLKKEYEAKEKEYSATKEKLAVDLKNLIVENKKQEEEWIKSKLKLQSNKIETTIKEYDKEMIENAQQLEREMKGYNENKEALEMLEENIRQLRMEKARIEEENKREALKLKNYDNLQQQKELASAYIAAHWKGLKSRQDYEKLKKTKKKGRKKAK